MEKNKRIIVIISVLIVGIGVSLAYFVGKTLFQGNGAKTKVTTAHINGATLEIYGRLEFNASDMLPGHTEVSRIDIRATGDNDLVAYNLIWKGTNTLQTKLKYTVYKVTEIQEVEAECKRKTETISAGQKMYEECSISNIEKLGSAIKEGEIGNGDTTLVEDEFINASPTGEKVSYYIIIEYPNRNEDQSEYDKNGSFNGEITIGESTAEPDINIVAMYIRNEDTGEYQETKEVPEGYWTLSERSTCNNGAKPKWDNDNHGVLVSDLSKSGTSCVLYLVNPAKEMIAKLEAAKGGDKYTIDTSIVNGSFGKDERESTNKLYKYPENNDYTYVFRGNVTDNWLRFANKTWRIIRINSDGTLRVIFQCNSNNCTTTTGSGTNAVSSKVYNASSTYNKANTGVGFYYGTAGSNDYNQTHSNKTPSTIADEVTKWYGTNLSSYTSKISGSTGFCNDRRIAKVSRSGYTGDGTGTNATAYLAVDRYQDSNWSALTSVTPDLSCEKNDLYTLKGEAGEGNGTLEVPAALITADEVALAGMLYGPNNVVTSNWLYTNRYYWTMSPEYFSSIARVFRVNSDGSLGGNNVDGALDVRPVINLKADINITGKGTEDEPFVVATD